MTRRAWTVAAVLTAAATIGGCASAPQAQSGALPEPTISSAKFRYSQPNTVVITGAYFKIKSDSKLDVVASLNGRNWAPATLISESSTSSYTAQIPYGVGFSQVWVRVYGIDEQYSAPALIQGQQR